MKRFAYQVLAIIGAILLITLPISVTHKLSNDKPCLTKGRYLPITYLFCVLSEPLEK